MLFPDYGVRRTFQISRLTSWFLRSKKRLGRSWSESGTISVCSARMAGRFGRKWRWFPSRWYGAVKTTVIGCESVPAHRFFRFEKKAS